MFRTDEAATFAAAFYGCIFAAVIPVAIEPPATKDVSVECPCLCVHECMFGELHAAYGSGLLTSYCGI